MTGREQEAGEALLPAIRHSQNSRTHGGKFVLRMLTFPTSFDIAPFCGTLCPTATRSSGRLNFFGVLFSVLTCPLTVPHRTWIQDSGYFPGLRLPPTRVRICGLTLGAGTTSGKSLPHGVAISSRYPVSSQQIASAPTRIWCLSGRRRWTKKQELGRQGGLPKASSRLVQLSYKWCLVRMITCYHRCAWQPW